MKKKMYKNMLYVIMCIVVLLSSASCGSKSDKSGSETDNYISVSDLTMPTTGDEDDDYTFNSPAQTNASGSVIAPEAKSIRASKALSAYKKAVASIKKNSVGFKKMQWQDFNDINTADTTGIADMVLTIVSKNVIKNNSYADAQNNAVKVSNGDTAGVKQEFPLFGSDSSVVLSSDECIAKAEYQKTENEKEYYIYFNDAFNPAMGEDGFGGIMTPLDRNIVLDSIHGYGIGVKKDTVKFDCTYKNSYLLFKTDKNGNLTYLEQNLYAEIDAKAEIDLYVASTNFLNGRCLYEEHYIYTDFTY